MLDLQGARDVTVDNTSSAQHNHDQEWHGSASGGWSVFKASASASSESHFRQSLSNLESIKIECDYLGEYWIRRRDWFDSTIFENKYVKEYLKNHPKTGALMALCISSAFIVRGLRIIYKFKSTSDTTIWSSWSAGGSGGFSCCGISFGMSGGGSGSKYDKVVNEKERTVTFLDGPNVCRLIALRASDLIPDIQLEAIGLESKFLDRAPLGEAVLRSWRKGVGFGDPALETKLVKAIAKPAHSPALGAKHMAKADVG